MEILSKNTSINPDKYRSLLLEFTSDKELVEFLIQNNVAHFKDSMYLTIEGEQYSFEHFLGRSKNTTEDLLKVFEAYEGRIPDKYIAVAVVNEVDFVCAGPGSKLYLWRRDVNDLYFEEGSRNTYKKQDKKLYVLADNFNGLMALVAEWDGDAEDEEFEDDFENPNIPFEDADIEDDFKHPELFFKQPENDVRIQLKKLSLSKKGKELLSVFREKGLL